MPDKEEQITFMDRVVRHNIDWGDLDIIYWRTHGVRWQFIVTDWPLGALSCGGLEVAEERVDRAITAARLKFWDNVKMGKAEDPRCMTDTVNPWNRGWKQS